MKIFVVYVGEIEHCPPALSVVQVLGDLNHDTILCTIGKKNNAIFNSLRKKNIRIKSIGDDYKSDISLWSKFGRMFNIRKRLFQIIDKEYDDNSIIWVLSEGSLKHLGDKIMNYRYILHLLELHEGIYYVSHSSLLKMNYKRIARMASVVVEAEYNRAHITKAWWGLDKLPIVLPNKPYNTINIKKNAEITSSKEVKELMDNLSDKKIILYQGNISKERPLQEYVKAVAELGDEYAFVMMINGNNPYPELKFSNFYVINFINPPLHLEITSRAYIGILSYTPIKNDYSILNTLYCAPNKIWEYSQFGVPMISNDLPALREMFMEYNNGICLENLKKSSIKKAIQDISKNYDLYSKESLRLFDSVDIKEIVKYILEKAIGNDK